MTSAPLPLLLLLLLPSLLPAAYSLKELSMFHVSDLHLDSSYAPGGPTDSRCHALPSPSGEDGQRGVNHGEVSPAGDYRCDPPRVLVESAFSYMRTVKSDPDLIVWTGDSAPHWKDGPKFDYIFDNLRNISGFFHK